MSRDEKKAKYEALLEKFSPQFHQDSFQFELLPFNEFLELAEDIKERGQLEKIEWLEGKILDGRNRYLACLFHGILPKSKNLPDSIDPFDHVISRNLRRRHLNAAQRAEIGVRILEREKIKAQKRKQATQFNGRDGKNQPVSKASVRGSIPTTEGKEEKGKAIDIAADKSQSSPKTIRKAQKIINAINDDVEIEEDWKNAKLGRSSVEEVYQKFKKKEKLDQTSSSKPQEKQAVREPNLPEDENILQIRKNCLNLRLAPCPHCMSQIFACLIDMEKGRLILRDHCKKDCSDFNY